MITAQQQSLNLYSYIARQRQKAIKISLKSKRSYNLASKVNKTLSFCTKNQEQRKKFNSTLPAQKSQISSISGMFRYFKNNIDCCQLLNTEREDLHQDRRIKQTNKIMYKTASTLKSSFTTDDKFQRRRQVKHFSQDPSNCSKEGYVVQKQNKLNSFLNTQNDFEFEDKNLLNYNFFTTRKKANSVYLNCTMRFPKNSKFSLKRKQSNIQKLGKSQIGQMLGNSNKFALFQSENGLSECHCLPQCFWIDKWLKLIKTNIGPLISKADPKFLLQIEKDIQYTRFNLSFYKSAKTQNSLKEVLTMYSSVSPHLGYFQGMNFIASVIVYHSQNVAQSFAIFNLIMKQKQYQKIYAGDFSLSLRLAKNLIQQLKLYQPQIHRHIMQNGIEAQIYARNWYFSMLGNFVPLESMHFVIDKFLKKGFQGINQLLLSLLIYLKQDILSFQFEEVALVFTIDWLSKRSQNIDWLQIVGFSQNIPLNAFQL